MFDSASREIVGPTLGYIVFGILAAVLVAVLIPKGYMQNQVDHDDLYAPIVVALLATPIYSSPLLAMSQVGGMFQHGNSIGAAFSLLILGAGTNFGLLLWFGVTYGFKRMSVFCLLLLVSTIGLAYVIDKPLYPKGVEPAGHTHAFDVYTHPFAHGQSNVLDQAKLKAKDFWKSNEFGGTYLIGTLFLLGAGFTLVRKSFDLERWLTQAKQSSGLDRDLPGWVLGLTSVVGLVAASVTGCFMYYPAPDDLLADLVAINADCVVSARTKDWDAAEKWIRYSDDLSRRLEVGVFLRTGAVAEFQSSKAKVYRQKLDELKEFVESQNPNGIEDKAQEVATAYLRMSASFRELEL